MNHSRTQALWSRLQAIVSFRFAVQPGAVSHTGWAGKAEGAVAVTIITTQSLVFEESGTLIFPDMRRINISNRYVWTYEDACVTLSHKRQGKLVTLVSLYPDADSINVWHSHTPHLCGKDIYAATLWEEGELLKLNWRIKGPRKDERIEVVYAPLPRKR